MNSIHPLSFVLALIYSLSSSAQAEFTDCDNCPTMVEIPSGTVVMGSASNAAYRRAGERPEQTVTITQSFAMAKTEVTLKQYRQFIFETNHQSAEIRYQGKTLLGCNYFDGKSYGFVVNHNWQSPGFAQREDEPVLCVSWSDASSYAKWLTKKTGRSYRVPSTVEFEYALRAGSDTPWFWGTDPDQACEFANVGDRAFGRRYPNRSQFGCDDGYVYTTSVARFKANAFGLHDMIGNAWEWTNDCWHDDLTSAPTDGSSWQQAHNGDCTFRTPKGGGWISGPGWSRGAVRSKDHKDYRSFMLGFRVAAEMKKPVSK